MHPAKRGKKGGIVSIVGVYDPTDNLVPIGNVVIRANRASVKRLLPRLIEHVQAGRLNPKAIISHHVPLEEVADPKKAGKPTGNTTGPDWYKTSCLGPP